ncbi:hypothetical protein ACFL67_03990, partial [candidate division KSB1 bacterium]
DVGKWYSPESIVLDGCPLLNLTAWAIIYKEDYFNPEICKKAIQILSSGQDSIPKSDPMFEQFPELKTLKRLNLDRMRLPKAVVFIDTPTETAIERIDKRGEERQVHETGEKLQKLREAYTVVCNVIAKDFKIPTAIIDGNKSINDITAEVITFIGSVKNPEENHA